MNEIDRQQRRWIARQTDKLNDGQISRREFIRRAALAGFGISNLGYLAGCAPLARPSKQQIQVSATAISASETISDAQKFLRDVGGKFKGRKLTIVTEATHPSLIISQILQEEFIPLTGIEVEWQMLALDQILAKLSQDSANQTGANDIYYWDHAWLSRFANEAVDLQGLIAKTDLAYPHWNFADFLPQLVATLATHQGRLVAIPFDIPIAILMYRRDVFAQLGLQVPTTLPAYLETVKTIHEAALRGVDGSSRLYGTTGQWKSGHQALTSDFNLWLWAHGGSLFGADGKPSIQDAQAQAALAYMMELGQYMPEEVTAWDWAEQAESFRQGNVGMYLSWGEFFPGFDDPAKSKIVGLAEAVAAPQEIALRSKADCGFAEIPGISQQNGSALAINKYSKNIDAAWIFLQWTTSADISARASSLGGSTTPTRKSSFSDPRIVENAKVVSGTTRHFGVQLDAIENRLGSAPQLPAWASLNADHFAVELGKLTSGQQDIKTTLENMTIAATQAMAYSQQWGWL